MRIGEVAHQTGLEASAIRFYETKQIVPAPRRTSAGYRAYGPDQIELLRFVRRLRSLELPLDDVREIVALRVDGTAPCGLVREAIAREAATIDQKIEDLQRIQVELARLQTESEQLIDNWPSSCVCHVVGTERESVGS